jgi:hypothetical protein
MATAVVITPLMFKSPIKRPAPGVPSSSLALPVSKKQRVQELSPVSVLRVIFGELGLKKPASSTFLKPSDNEVDAYDIETVRAIRMGDLTTLKRLHAEGKDLNASNQFGESLLHMACRRGNVSILSFMLREAKVRVNQRDDFGRNILHDACWTSTPNLDIMDELIEFVDPLLMLSEDVRGSTPFDYCRRDHWKDWVQYLSERKETLEARIQQIERQATSEESK